MNVLPKLEIKHWMWIFELAAEGFEKEVAGMEAEIVRHERFINTPIATPHINRNTDRSHRIRVLVAAIEERAAILTVLREVRDGLSDLSAEECAAAFLKMKKMEKKEEKKASSIPV